MMFVSLNDSAVLDNTRKSYDPRKSVLSPNYRSKLFRSLLKPFHFTAPNMIRRLSALSELKNSYQHPHVQRWVLELLEQTWTAQGFSAGPSDRHIHPTYNAMTTSLLINLGYPDHDVLRVGINWILNHQPVSLCPPEEGQLEMIARFGNNLVKSMAALSAYQQTYPEKWTNAMQEKLTQGMEALLNLEWMTRNPMLNSPVCQRLMRLEFPFNQNTSILEVLRLLRDQDKLEDVRCQSAIQWLRAQRQRDGHWLFTSMVEHPAWVPFGEPGLPNSWITRLATDVLHRASIQAA